MALTKGSSEAYNARRIAGAQAPQRSVQRYSNRTFSLPVELLDVLDAFAAENRMTKSGVVAEALREYIR